MFMPSTKLDKLDQTQKIGPIIRSIVIIANGDLFSECLVESLAKKFPAFEVVSKEDTRQFLQDDPLDARLVLFYRVSAQELHESLRLLRESHVLAAVGIVVDAVEMPEPYICKLVETRIIDGVLPLSLRLDVFIAAVDLLMKGGEHFPSALLGKLTGNGRHASVPSFYETRSDVGMNTPPLSMNNGDMSSLTTREIQILDLICKGTQNKIIADKLHLSENTVKVHVRNIYKKMNVRNRTEAASRFFNGSASRRAAHGGWNN